MDKTIVKAFDLLGILAANAQPMGVTALAEQAELGKSNVHRILQTLVGLGYVERTEAAQYQPTIRIWELGSQVMSRLSLRDVARPAMQELSELTGEAVHLSLLMGAEVLYVDKIESSEPVRAYTQLGGRAPAYCTATGKAMLAFAGDAAVTAAMADATAYTDTTLVDAESFLAEATKIRKNRFSVNRGEWRADVIGLGSPIADAEGSVVAAIGLSAPGARLGLAKLKELAPKLISHARGVSAALGCTDQAWDSLTTRSGSLRGDKESAA